MFQFHDSEMMCTILIIIIMDSAIMVVAIFCLGLMMRTQWSTIRTLKFHWCFPVRTYVVAGGRFDAILILNGLEVVFVVDYDPTV